jgi:hypothetical protein
MKGCLIQKAYIFDILQKGLNEEIKTLDCLAQNRMALD